MAHNSYGPQQSWPTMVMVVQELTDDYEYKLQEERMHVEHLKEEKDELIRQIEETRRQVEEDADREIEELKEKYEAITTLGHKYFRP